MCLGRLESVIIPAGYGPDPDVTAPVPLGDSVPVAPAGTSAVYLGRSLSEIQNIPRAMVSSPVAGK